MDKSLIVKWVEALRSGKYQQGKYSLRERQEDNSYRYCYYINNLTFLQKARPCAIMPHAARAIDKARSFRAFDLPYQSEWTLASAVLPLSCERYSDTALYAPQ